MSKDYLDKWEERAKKNTEIIDQQQTKTKMSKEEVVEMLVYFAEQYPDMFYKHMEDDDLGEGAFTEFVEEYINGEKND